MKLFLFFLSLLVVNSCSNESTSYFPFNKIKSWNYTIQILPEVDESIIYKRTNESLEKIVIKDNDIDYEVFPILKENGTLLYYEILDTGIYRNGVKFNKDVGVNFEKKKRMVMPASLQVGEKWQVESKTYLILKRYPYYDYRATTNFKLNYEIVSMSEDIQTPSGKFKNCLKLEGTGKTSFIGDSEIGSIEIDIFSEEWYAKDVGLVKTVRTEKTDTELFGTTKMVQLLDNYKKK